MNALVNSAQAHWALVMVADGNTAGDVTERRNKYARACARETIAGYAEGYAS